MYDIKELDKFIDDFLNDPDELEAFISGPAGSGKTTYTKQIIENLNKRLITYRVVAYTHKASEVLMEKLPPNTEISTLHSWLKKRPGLNAKATNLNSIMISKQFGKPEPLQLLIVDEYSFVGEKDYYSIGELQDENNIPVECPRCHHWHDPEVREVIEQEGSMQCWKCPQQLKVENLPNLNAYKPLKVLYIGDANQLQPVKDIASVFPAGKYQIELTHIYRQDNSDLLDISEQIRQMIESGKPTRLEPSKSFKRNVDIVNAYMNDLNPSKRLLAYTNFKVQYYNKLIEEKANGKLTYDLTHRVIYNYTLRKELIVQNSNRIGKNIFMQEVPKEVEFLACDGQTMINWDTKYNPLETISQFTKKYPTVPLYLLNISSIGWIIAILGVNANKLSRQLINNELVSANKKFGFDSKESKIAYKNAKVLNDIVHKIDFNHCQTIHTTQGQEYDNIYLDIEDVIKAPNYLTLLYVGVTRAKQQLCFNA